ncbi:DUF1553 domain-containing protein [Verrucomicrobia bacterium]|nr:DUF1553 domain-containing protein [Verrucomicrobiota bacterium]
MKIILRVSTQSEHPNTSYEMQMKKKCLGFKLRRWIMTSLLAFGQFLAGEIMNAQKSGLLETVNFNSQIRPILSDRCYPCHGPDKETRKAHLRLDLKKNAFSRLEGSQDRAFVKGDLEKSIAWQKIVTHATEDRMPPPESGLKISVGEMDLIKQWIEQGAEWQEHWAFTAPSKPIIPLQQKADRLPEHPIDAFIFSKLIDKGLKPSPEAERALLIRRLSFDLTGLPPSLEEVDAFLADGSPLAYERLVDRLLASPAHAERLAVDWLDVARYGDTQGMHADTERYHWPWRDWVINAFSRNLPYNEFIIWQLAGDLLKNPVREQKLATAFQRNHPVSAEGGIIDEEFRIKYVQDRINTVGTAFMGLTLACASCHDHKYDPVSQKDYYRLMAFFNNIKELGMVAEGGGSSGPILLLPEQKTQRALTDLSDSMDHAFQALTKLRTKEAFTPLFLERAKEHGVTPPVADYTFPLDAVQPADIKVKGTIHRVIRNTPINKIVDNNPDSVASGNPSIVEGRIGNAVRFNEEYDLIFLRNGGTFEVHQPFSAGAWVYSEKEGSNQTIMGVSGDLTSKAWRGWDFFLDAQNRPSIRMIGFWPQNFLQVSAKRSIPAKQWHHVLFSYDGLGRAEGAQLYIDGREVECVINHDHLYRTIVHPWNVQEGWTEKPVMVGRSGRFYTGDNGAFMGAIDHITLFRRRLSSLQVAALLKGQTDEPMQWSTMPASAFMDHFLFEKHADAKVLIRGLREDLARKIKLLEKVPEIMVMEEMPVMRKTFVLKRGQYDTPAEEVRPGVPASLLAFGKNRPPNRLGLAQWLTDPKHPLTARVTVNRYWQMIFGRGMVETSHDFGIQGALPTHPELLDWLAVSFMESGWNLRKLIRSMVTSSTYRQSSTSTGQQVANDPKNLYLSRGPFRRLSAEMIRDNILSVSALLTRKVGGPSVKPYQPAGLWAEKTGPGSAYRLDKGENLYRRSIYTFIRRTTPPPAMIAFDAPNRSVCTVRREETHTPIQALIMLNNPEFVEAARGLVQRIQTTGKGALEDQLADTYRFLCGRKPDTVEMTLMLDLYAEAASEYQNHPEEAARLLQVGKLPFNEDLDKVHTASLCLVASTLMNFDGSYMQR